MILRAGDTAIYVGHFTETKLGKTGLTVTYNIYRNGGIAPVGSGSASEVAQGLYRATFTTTVDGDYVCMFATATTTVDQMEIPAMWVALAWADLIDAAISSTAAPGDPMTLAANAITDSVLAADTDTYQAKVILLDDEDNSVDRYAVSWFKNGQPINAGITVPKIQVVKVADGSDLVAETAMTQIAALGRYRYTASAAERITSGLAYLAIVTATIDGSTRSWDQYVGRDSS